MNSLRGDFTYRDWGSRQVQLFLSFLNFQATILLHLLYFSTYSDIKTLDHCGKKSVTAKEAMTNRTKSEFTSHCRIASKTNFLMLLLFPTRFAHARYSSRMIDRFLNWGDHGKPKSGKIKGRCHPSVL